MGLYFHVYAGPALICKYHQTEVVTKKTVKVNVCSNGHKSDGKFCSKCGQPTAIREKENESRKQVKSVDNIYDLMSEGGFREDVFQDCWGGLNNEKLIDDHDVFVPTSDFLGRKTQFKANEFAIHVQSPNIQEENAKFEEFYAKEIAYLRTKYDDVRIEWLVLTDGR